MPLRKIHSDEKGLYLNINGSKKRPGNQRGYSHAYRMDAGPLKAGDYVNAGHVSQTSLVKIMCWENKKPIVLHWYTEN